MKKNATIFFLCAECYLWLQGNTTSDGFLRKQSTYLAASTWVPMGARAPVLSPNEYPIPFPSPQEGFGNGQNFETFQIPLNGLAVGKKFTLLKNVCQIFLTEICLSWKTLFAGYAFCWETIFVEKFSVRGKFLLKILCRNKSHVATLRCICASYFVETIFAPKTPGWGYA